MPKILLALAVFLILAAPTRAQNTPYTLGSPIPETLSFTDSTGATRTLSAWSGKPVVLEWTNYGCPFVGKHYRSGNMQALQAWAAAQGAAWVSVISSAPGKEGYLTQTEAPAAIARMGFKGTAVALDSTGTLGRTFGATTTPFMVVLNQDHTLAYMGGIDSIAGFSPEDIPHATNYVRQALSQILAGQPVTTPAAPPYGCSVKY